MFRRDNSFIAVVYWDPKDSLADLICVNELLIREYTWEGRLLLPYTSAFIYHKFGIIIMIKGMRYGSIYGISYLDKKNV